MCDVGIPTCSCVLKSTFVFLNFWIGGTSGDHVMRLLRPQSFARSVLILILILRLYPVCLFTDSVQDFVFVSIHVASISFLYQN